MTPAESLGGFRILGEIGRGALATVYRAERRGTLAALKVLHDPWARDPAAAARFAQEGRLQGSLDHPGIVRLLEAGRDHNRPFLALEYIEGPSLARALSRRAFTRRETALLLARVADALHFAHGRGVLHGDVTPSNILLKGDGTPKLGDFGLARLRGFSAGQGTAGGTGGTPLYMSPEQAAGLADIVDVRSDIYSLGAVLYHAATGCVPFAGDSAAGILRKVLQAAPLPPRAADPTVDPRLEAIILQAMDKDSARRYATAQAFAVALRAWAWTARDWDSVLSP